MDKGTFLKLYIQNIRPEILKFENKRKQILKGLVLKEFFLGMCALILIYITYKCFWLCANVFGSYFSPIKGTLIILFSLFVLPACIIMSLIEIYLSAKKAKEKFKNDIKNVFLNQITEYICPIRWKQNKTWIDLQLIESNLFPMYSLIEYDDTFEGNYQEVKFQVQELKLIRTGRKNEKEVVYNGVVICIPSNKKVNAQTIITSKYDLNIQNRIMPSFAMFIISAMFLLGAIFATYWLFQKTEMQYTIGENVKHIFDLIFVYLAGIAFCLLGIDQIKNERLYEKIKLEDLNFDKLFNVQSQDQVEARYLVTPSFMERLQNLQTAFGTKDIKCSFFDDQIMFAISTNKDIFEIGDLFVSLDDIKTIEKFYDEISSVYNMIDYFKLTQKTGL